MGGYDHVMITVNDGVDINVNVTCSRSDEGATLNVACPPNIDCLTITCPYIDIMCGTTQKPFECYYGHYDDIKQECICNPGYKGETCLNHDIGFETLQLYSSGDTILITYYPSGFCIYGLQWGDSSNTDNINGFWKFSKISANATQSEQYNPVYINENNENYKIYYKHCDETWYIENTEDNQIIGKCLHNKFDWTDYGAVVSCNSFWYIDHNLDGTFLRDINIKMSTGQDSEECATSISNVASFVDYEYICIDEGEIGISGTYEYNDRYNGYGSWKLITDDDDTSEYYLTFEGASWRIHDNHNDFYVCYTFENDPVESCNGEWLGDGDIFITDRQCHEGQFPTLPTAPTAKPTLEPTKTPIISATVINEKVCLSRAGGSFDGTYVANGTFNDKQIFIKEYLPQLNRPFVYLFHRDSSWIIYRDEKSSDFWFLKCENRFEDVTHCNKTWITSWSGNEPTILINKGECQEVTHKPTMHGHTLQPTKKPTVQPITGNQTNYNYMCIKGTTFSDLDGTYSYNGSYGPDDQSLYKKEYIPQEDKPWVYIKFEEHYDHYNDDIYGWIIYRKLNTQNYYFYCDIEWAEEYYVRDDSISQDPTECNGHWITSWYNDDDENGNNITLSYGMCVDDIIISDTPSPTEAPIEFLPSTSKYCGSTAIDESDDRYNDYFYDSICLNNVDDKSLEGIYKLNGIYNGYPSYIKEYLPDEDKPFVYIKYEDVIIGDIDNDGIIDTRKQWIVYREYCAQTYYLYCEHLQNSSDINQCSGYWHTSWSGKEINITSSSNLNDILNCGGNQKYNQDSQETPVPEIAPLSICMSNTGTNSLDGEYEHDGHHNGYVYYKKSYIVGSNTPYVYIKYERKWMIYKDLEDERTYFLECDAAVNSIDVTQCDKKWKGGINSDSNNIRSIDCSSTTLSPGGEIIEKAEEIANLFSPKQKKMLIIVGIIVGFLFFVCFIACICKRADKKSKKKHKFNRLQDNDDEDDDEDGFNVETSEDDDDEINATYLQNDADQSGPGGGTKQKRSNKTKKNTNKFTNVFKKKSNNNKNNKKMSGIDESENVELVSSSNDDIGLSAHVETKKFVLDDGNGDDEEDEDEDDDEEIDDEFTNDFGDHDDDVDQDDEEENMLNGSHDLDGNAQIDSISYVSPHNRLEID